MAKHVKGSAIANASSYKLYLADGTELATQSTNVSAGIDFDLSTIAALKAVGTYSLGVKAISGDTTKFLDSLMSNLVSYTVDNPVTPTNYTFTLNPTPTSATVTLSATGYSTVSGTGSKSITVANGVKVNWSVSASGYTTRTGDWTISGGNKTENITLTASGGDTPVGTELEEIQTTTGYYINASNLSNTVNEAFNIGKYDVSTVGRIKATCRQGTVSAAVFTNAQGVRTLAGTGNTDSGVNYIVELDVPYDAVYFELTYATKYEHSVIKLAEREVIDVDSYTVIESESTTEGYYIDKDMKNASNSAFAIGKYNVSNYSKVYVEARVGAIAYLAWTDSSGKRTQAGVGNSGAGLNYKQILTVPETAVYLEVGYSTSQPCTVKGGE